MGGKTRDRKSTVRSQRICIQFTFVSRYKEMVKSQSASRTVEVFIFPLSSPTAIRELYRFPQASQKDIRTVPKSTYDTDSIAVHLKITNIPPQNFIYTYNALILTVKKKLKIRFGFRI